MKNNNDDECLKHNLFVCEFCHKHFPSDQSLVGHKTSHRSNNKQYDDAPKTTKITFSLYSDHTKQNKHSWTRVFPSNMATKPTASTLKPITLNQLPALHSLAFLPPKKRITRFLAQHPLTPILPSVANDTPDSKRMKLSSNVNDTQEMQKPSLPLTIDRPIDETVVKEEKNLSQGETVASAASTVVRNFDLNELATNDVGTKLGPRVVRNFDLSELPTNDVEIE